MYANFFLKGPSQMKRILKLNPDISFSNIQCALFMKYAAQIEVEKATGERPRKGFLETVMMRSFKNQFKDSVMQWKNLFSYMKYQRELKKQGKDE